MPTPTQKKPFKLSPTFALLLGSIMISFSPVFVKLTPTPPTIDGVYRMLFGGIILLAVSFWRKERLYANIKALQFTGLAAFFLSLYVVLWHQGVDLIGPGLATIILNLQVFALVTCGIVLFAEKTNWKFFLAIPLTVVGLYLLVGSEWSSASSDYHSGIVASSIAVFCYTAYLLMLRKSQSLKKPLTIIPFVAEISLISAAILAVIAYLQGQSFHIVSVENALLLVGYGLCAQCIGWLFIAYGLPETRLSLAGFLLLLQPALSFIWDISFFHRPTTTTEIIGVIITLIAIYFGATGKKL